MTHPASCDLTLAIDVGTGSARAALVDAAGRIVAIAGREYEQIVPRFGWSQQRPADWWDGVAGAIREVLDGNPGARERIAAVCACGQMHGTVLIDDAGNVTRETVPLWNDKRTVDLVAAFEAANAPGSYLTESGNPPTPAWAAFKLQWIRDTEPEAFARSATVLAPKDYINFRLTGEIATDVTEASCNFLMNPATRDWSAAMIARLGLDARMMPPIRQPEAILGGITEAAARATGLAAGTPVLVGGADYPMALLGSGVCRPGLASEVLGTSCIITLVTGQAVLDPEISNVATMEGNWGPFMLLESGGDAMRWARRALHDGRAGYGEIVETAAEAPAGSAGLIFLPYLTGERFGAHRNARAQFFGLGASHGLAHLDRAVMEGVALGVARHIRVLEENSGLRVSRVIASGGGARTPLWLKIKASAYGIPVVVPQEPECGVIGCAALAATATGRFSRVEDAADAFVRFADEIVPDPRWSDIYAATQPVFDRLYRHSQALYDDLDQLAARTAAIDARFGEDAATPTG